MLIRILTGSNQPVYEQIAREIRRLIFEGEIDKGDTLPPVRQLANDLGVNLNTVAQAYRILEGQGLVQIKRGSGATVIATTISNGDVRVIEEELRTLYMDLCLMGWRNAEIEQFISEQWQHVRRERFSEEEGGENEDVCSSRHTSTD